MVASPVFIQNDTELMKIASNGNVISRGGHNGRSDTEWIVQAGEDVSYEVVYRVNLTNSAKREDFGGSSAELDSVRRLVFVDSGLSSSQVESLRNSLTNNGYEPTIHTLIGGESNKAFPSLEKVLSIMDHYEVDRRSEPVLVVGGGVVLDVVSLAASLFRRGVPHIRIPTTLLAMVDAAIGVKTAINFNGKKNRVGTYYAPTRVIVDPEFLSTLPSRHIFNGISEIIKMALVCDDSLFAALEQSTELSDWTSATDLTQRISATAIKAMLHELAPNLREGNLYRAVDFGHWLSPQIELVDDDLLHGEAVAIDMAITCVIAMGRGLMEKNDVLRTLDLFRKLQLPISSKAVTKRAVSEALENLIKHRDGLQRIPVPVRIGAHGFLNNVTEIEAFNAASQVIAMAEESVAAV